MHFELIWKIIWHLLSVSTPNIQLDNISLLCVTGFFTPAAMLVIMSYVGCDRALAVFLLTVAVGVSGAGISGYGVNHLDIGPPFAGKIVRGFRNSIPLIV